VSEQDTPHATLVEVVRAAVELVPGCEDASVSLVQRRRTVSSDAASGELPRRIDALQEELKEGPCIDAAFLDATVRVDDLATETRWPRFAADALSVGAASMLCFQLFVEGDNLGALNLYGHEPNNFTEESEHVGLLFVSHAAVAMAGAQKHDQMVAGLATRDLIGQAKGILMERYKIDAQKAFSLLVRASQHRNLKLRDLAAELTDTGRIADVTPAPRGRPGQVS
jgi:transcriptional regulator with GAF, ATPase, and Fis domain